MHYQKRIPMRCTGWKRCSCDRCVSERRRSRTVKRMAYKLWISDSDVLDRIEELGGCYRRISPRVYEVSGIAPWRLQTLQETFVLEAS